MIDFANIKKNLWSNTIKFFVNVNYWCKEKTENPSTLKKTNTLQTHIAVSIYFNK